MHLKTPRFETLKQIQQLDSQITCSNQVRKIDLFYQQQSLWLQFIVILALKSDLPSSTWTILTTSNGQNDRSSSKLVTKLVTNLWPIQNLLEFVNPNRPLNQKSWLKFDILDCHNSLAKQFRLELKLDLNCFLQFNPSKLEQV